MFVTSGLRGWRWGACRLLVSCGFKRCRAGADAGRGRSSGRTDRCMSRLTGSFGGMTGRVLSGRTPICSLGDLADVCCRGKRAMLLLAMSSYARLTWCGCGELGWRGSVVRVGDHDHRCTPGATSHRLLLQDPSVRSRTSFAGLVVTRDAPIVDRALRFE